MSNSPHIIGKEEENKRIRFCVKCGKKLRPLREWEMAGNWCDKCAADEDKKWREEQRNQEFCSRCNKWKPKKGFSPISTGMRCRCGDIYVNCCLDCNINHFNSLL